MIKEKKKPHKPMGEHLPGALYKHANTGNKSKAEIIGTTIFWILAFLILK